MFAEATPHPATFSHFPGMLFMKRESDVLNGQKKGAARKKQMGSSLIYKHEDGRNRGQPIEPKHNITI